MTLRTLTVFGAALLLCGCPGKKEEPGGGGPVPVNRCEFDVAGSALFSQVGNGASAKIAQSDADLIGGEAAQGQVGDAVMANDKIRVVIQRPARNIAPTPFGGFLIDGDLVHDGPGKDTFGRLGFFYSFGRSIDATDIEVLNDGSNGGAAVVAVTGKDAENDYVNVPNVIGSYLPGAKFVIDPRARSRSARRRTTCSLRARTGSGCSPTSATTARPTCRCRWASWSNRAAPRTSSTRKAARTARHAEPRWLRHVPRRSDGVVWLPGGRRRVRRAQLPGRGAHGAGDRERAAVDRGRGGHAGRRQGPAGPAVVDRRAATDAARLVRDRGGREQAVPARLRDRARPRRTSTRRSSRSTARATRG